MCRHVPVCFKRFTITCFCCWGSEFLAVVGEYDLHFWGRVSCFSCVIITQRCISIWSVPAFHKRLLLSGLAVEARVFSAFNHTHIKAQAAASIMHRQRASVFAAALLLKRRQDCPPPFGSSSCPSAPWRLCFRPAALNPVKSIPKHDSKLMGNAWRGTSWWESCVRAARLLEV